MSAPNEPPSEPLDGVPELSPEIRRATRPPAELRERILNLTTAVVRRQRRTRHVLRAAALLLAFGLGLGAGWTARAGIDRRAPEPPPEGPAILAESEEGAPGGLDTARQSPADRIEALRQEGDQLLQQTGDVASALRCYSEYLALLPPEQRETSRHDDSWLLLALRRTP